MEEIWKVIDNYNDYSVSNLGNVKNNKTNKLLKFKNYKDGYQRIIVRNDTGNKNYAVHRLVASVFLKNLDENKIYINHKNGIKSDNRLDNLEYVTQSENMKHAVVNNLLKPAKKKVAQYSKDLELINVFNSITEAAQKTNIERSQIGKTCNVKVKYAGSFIWKFINPNIKDNIESNELSELKNFEGYGITTDGKIYSYKRNKFIKSFVNGGYSCIKLMQGKERKNLFVHRLVAETFIHNPDPKNKIFVNHKNKNRLDNRIINLEWVTPSENVIHSINFKSE
ncbi:HNH endonuclease [Catovirus CTV1]|uniref:HNH endonuclease n=1 Tax=Catovirus CTV1 TaxID=1977631 RepID=A0A1V0SB90_9VIRU|nr:HNH endonuclease [Catovirus CTV1]